MKILENIKQILGLMIVIMAFAYFFCVLCIEKKSNDQILIAIVAMVSSVIGYYYGNSQGSAKKDEIIQNQMKP